MTSIEKIVFIGSKGIGLKALNEIHFRAPSKLKAIVTLDDSADERSVLREIKEFSKKNNIEFYCLTKSSELESVIKKIKPDLCFVIGWYWIIHAKILSMAPQGFIGVHGSLLPKYRGWAPFVWPIINGEKGSGVSLFYLDEGMDTGDIITQKKFSIGTNETIKDILSKAEDLMEGMFKEFFPEIIEGRAPRKKQKHTHASYGAQRKAADGRINWAKKNVDVYNFIRAQTEPYPGAFCLLPSKEKIILLEVQLFLNEYYGTPGLVVQTCGSSAIVTCGAGAIVVDKIKVPNGDYKNASEVLITGIKLE